MRQAGAQREQILGVAKDDSGGFRSDGWATRADVAIMQMLLANKTDVKARNDDEKTPLVFPAEKREPRRSASAVGDGADPRDADFYGKTALSRATDNGIPLLRYSKTPGPRSDSASVRLRRNDQNRSWNRSPITFIAGAV